MTISHKQFVSVLRSFGFVPWSRLEVKNGSSSRWVSGLVHSHTLSIGIFNPELSIDGLAFWAGFGAGVWMFSYDETDVFTKHTGYPGSLEIDADWSDMNLAGNIFIELDYKISDIFHVGIGLRWHILLANHTDEGRFYNFNGQNQSEPKRSSTASCFTISRTTPSTAANMSGSSHPESQTCDERWHCC